MKGSIAMKRNLDLIRHILLVTENSNVSRLDIGKYVANEYSLSEVRYHVLLLEDSGYLQVKEISPCKGVHPEYVVERLTSKGHDFLDTIRNDDIFDKTKNKLASTIGVTTLEIVKDVAISFIKTHFGI